MSINLYELKAPNMKWIKDIILEYNELGFYTTTSQPAISQFITANTSRKQRAYIRGYMTKEMADYIVVSINNSHNPSYSRLFVRSETYNRILDKSYCNCGSVIFINDKPIIYDFDAADEDVAMQSFNLGLPLRRPYSYFQTIFNTVPDNLQNMSEFDIVDHICQLHKALQRIEELEKELALYKSYAHPVRLCEQCHKMHHPVEFCSDHPEFY